MATTNKKNTIKKVATTKPVKTTIAAPVAKIVPTAPVHSKYINKNLKVSPRKLRLVVAAVKKLSPTVAVTQLKFTNSNAARILCKAIEDAIASAKNNYHLIPSSLFFTDIRVDEGMKIKRMDKSHGSRFARGIIQKRHSRLNITLSGTIQS
jgi:large subunit ribosomal protein L22